MVGDAARIEDPSDSFKIVVIKPYRNETTWKVEFSKAANIKMGLNEMWREFVNCTYVRLSALGRCGCGNEC